MLVGQVSNWSSLPEHTSDLLSKCFQRYTQNARHYKHEVDFGGKSIRQVNFKQMTAKTISSSDRLVIRIEPGHSELKDSVHKVLLLNPQSSTLFILFFLSLRPTYILVHTHNIYTGNCCERCNACSRGKCNAGGALYTRQSFQSRRYTSKSHLHEKNLYA